jgi:hypothetical protein
MIEKTLPIEADLTLLRSQLPQKRRQSRRQRCNLATMAKLQFPNSDEKHTAWVYNLSLGGVGLNSAQALDIGQELTITFRLPDAEIPSQHAKVIFSQLEADGSWRIGCEFHAPITQEILESLLS